MTQCAPCQRKAHDLAQAPPPVPPSFWNAALMREALGSWHLGQVIRAYRHHPFHGPRPLSQEVVAGWLNMTQTQLSRIEGGPPVNDLGKLTAWARVLGIPAGLLWFRLPEQYGQLSYDDAVASDGRPVITHPSAGMLTLGLVPFRGAASSSAGSDVAAMQAFRAADCQVGGGHLYATVVSYLHTVVAPRLFGSLASTGQPVFTAAAALTEMAGWMAHDAGRDAAAQQHFQRALDLASAGNDKQLGVHVLASMSHLALHRAEPGAAIRLARRGHEALADAPPNPALSARLLTLEARGLGALPQPDPALCGKALLKAEQMLDTESAEPSSPWISRFDEGSLASEAARCLRQLGQFDAAAEQARRIIKVRPYSNTRSRAFGQLLLASVLVVRGEPEEACGIARQVLDATQSLGSYLVLQQLRDLGQVLEQYRAERSIAEFLTVLDETLRGGLWLYSWLSAEGQKGEAAAETSQ
jgi:tetratricopeptide (TPR) repeat protein